MSVVVVGGESFYIDEYYRLHVTASISVRRKVNVVAEGHVQAHTIKEPWLTTKGLIVPTPRPNGPLRKGQVGKQENCSYDAMMMKIFC